MDQNFKVGDKVKFVDNMYVKGFTYYSYINGDVMEIVDIQSAIGREPIICCTGELGRQPEIWFNVARLHKAYTYKLRRKCVQGG